MGIAALVLGILDLLLLGAAFGMAKQVAALVGLGVLGLLFAFTTLMLSLAERKWASHRGRSTGMGTAALVLGILGIVLWGGLTTVAFTALHAEARRDRAPEE